MSILKKSIFAILIALSVGFINVRNIESEAGNLENDKPNIILLFADDLGYGDLACFGHPYAKTPNLDQLAAQGTIFRKFNVTGKTCHPSRVGLLTSRVPDSYPIDTRDYGFTQAENGYVDRVTIMELMKGAGYTTGHFGKWHIGPDKEMVPGVYGLDEYKELGGGGRDELGRDQKIYDRAITFIEAHKDEPFYLNVMGRVTHSPVAPRPELIEMAGFGTLDGNQLLVEPFVNREDFIGAQIQKSFDVVESANDPENIDEAQAAGISGDINYAMANYLTEVYFLDTFIGKLLDKLDELGIADNTIVMFTSDQGPAPTQFELNSPEKINLVGYSGGLRGQKHDEYEGGIRTSCIMRWPGNIPAGKVNTESTWSSLDWLPTLCQITGVEIDLNQIHGEEVLDIWKGSDRSRTAPLYWTRAMKIIDEEGEWRVYFGNGADPPVEELYNLTTDLQETNNLKDTRSDKAAEFQAMWVKWLENIDAENHIPEISAISNQEVAAGAILSGVTFTVSDPDNDFPSENITIASGDETLLPESSVSLTKNEGMFSLDIITEEDKTGEVEITITAANGLLTRTKSFTLSITENTTRVQSSLNDIKMHLYPNPGRDILIIDVHPNSVNQIHIFDSGGRLVLAESAAENSLDISDLESGVYHVCVTTNKGEVYQQKVLRQ